MRLSLQSSYLLDLVVRNDPRLEEVFAVLWFLVLCQLYLVTCGLHRKNIPRNQRGSGAMLLRGEVEDLVANKVLREWVLRENFNNPNDE